MGKKIVVVIALALLVPLTLSAQFVSSTIWVTIKDDVGGKDSMIFGNHVLATYCTDSVIGEFQSPPWAFGFTAVWTSITGTGRANCFTTLGMIKKDLRDFVNTAKKDTFDLYFQNSDSAAAFPGVNATLRWPDSSYLSQRCDSMFMVDRELGALIPTPINMFTQSSVVLTDVYDPAGPNPLNPVVKLKIFKYGTHQPWVDEVEPAARTVPKSFALHQNYPNPFNPTTTMRFDILNQALTDISVYNILGQKVATLISRELSRGSYTASWNGLSDHGLASPSGVYFVRMSAHSSASGGKEDFFSAVRKLVLMK